MKATMISQMVTDWLIAFRAGITDPVWDFLIFLREGLRKKVRHLESKQSSDTAFTTLGISSKKPLFQFVVGEAKCIKDNFNT